MTFLFSVSTQHKDVCTCRNAYMSCISNKQACFICKQRFCRQRLRWRCVCCPIASHDKCTAWPDEVMHLIGQPRRAVCWRHPPDWRQERKVNFFFPSSVVFFFLINLHWCYLVFTYFYVLTLRSLNISLM